jgi:hypothetical protein
MAAFHRSRRARNEASGSGDTHITSKARTNVMSKTHFGFETVDEQEKAKKVAGVFDYVASN